MITKIKKTSITIGSLNNQHWLILIFLIGIGVLPFSMSSAYHDSQRLLTIVALSLISTCHLIQTNTQTKTLMTIIGFVFVSGCFITLNSLSIEWSMIELLLFTTLALTIITTHYHDNKMTLRFFALTFALIQVIYIARSLLNYIVIVANRDALDVWNIIDGFSNIRFYAQFLSWTLPFILAYAYLNTKERHRTLLLSIVVASWTLVLMSGTRAFIFGILCSLFSAALFTPKLWINYAKGLLITGSFGLLGYFLLIYLLPLLIGIDNSLAVNSTANRDFTNSSGRIAIWQDTLTIIINHPFMGIGPMMTAMDGILDDVAHPHNFPLQLAAEWGIPFATLILLSFIYAGIHWRNAIKEDPTHRESLALPITVATSSAMAASLVDGIIVMPISLLYMAMIVGIGFSLWKQWSTTNEWVKIPRIVTSILIIIPFSLSLITTIQWQTLSNNYNASKQPRFWADGKIRINAKNPDTYFFQIKI